MKRRIYNVLLVTMAVLFCVQFGLIHAADATRLLFPHVANGAIQTRLVKLVAQDCGFVNAVATPDGRIFVAYQTRPDGHVHLTEQVGDELRARTTEVTQTIALAASELPGPKQGSVSQVVLPGELRTYYTGREENDPSGPFFVWVLIEPMPELMR